MTPSLTERSILIAKFPANLNLPEGQPSVVNDAAEAIKREYRSSFRWKRLRCRTVQHLPAAAGNIFILEVGQSIEFDWTWEGAVAFRSAEPAKFIRDSDSTDDFFGSSEGDDTPQGQNAVWAGEVVEVDEANGRIFVSVGSSGQRPCHGTFFVRPFEFLFFLHDVFCQREGSDIKNLLAPRLNAARGGIHPAVIDGPSSGMKDLEQMWGHSWSILWGPAGCGKTTTLGRQVAACLGGNERVLVVSTTNKATDAAALAIGKAVLAQSPDLVKEGHVLRIGKGAQYDAYEKDGLSQFLRGTETELLREIGSLTLNLQGSDKHEDRAVLRNQIQELRRSMKDRAFNIFVSPEVQVVVATAFKAITLLNAPEVRSMVAAGLAPFNTVVIDEAGLVPRTVVAGLSLLASRRVVVVGDAKQLAPISKVSRVLPTAQATWLASSGLTHLQHVEQVGPGVHMLREQHRMHPQVSKVVSHYQYEGALVDGPGVASRQATLPALLTGQPRAVWYVLDEDGQDVPSIRAERGPGNRSWVRPASREVLRKLFSDPEVRQAEGLFITPFRAQGRDIAGYLAAEHLHNWSAGTVHARQGTEADIVIFDTVNAGSCGWPYDEWKRLVNVGLSRAREFMLLLASRAEMDEPYMRPLLENLAPRVLRRSGRDLAWVEVPARVMFQPETPVAPDPDLLGSQVAKRKSLRPVMSAEQQRLCGHRMDGKPRLVRGVAGSGKTMVLAHWLQKTVRNLADKPDARVWAVYANRSLHRLIADTIEEAWKADGASGQFPWGRIQLQHVKDILEILLPEVGLRMRSDDFDYDAMAAAYLARKRFDQISPRCHAMFIDEAQDMGPSTLKLLSALVEPTDPTDPRCRAVNIFYDNAQNIYGRATPKWSDMGLDMRGRSTVMKESFRSTKPITEYALNILYRLQPPDSDPDHKELVDRGLVERTLRGGAPWWSVRFNQVAGPDPDFKKFLSLEAQIDALGKQVVRWIREEGLKPGDICILYNGKNIKWWLEQQVAPLLREIGSSLTFVGERGWDRSEGAVLASTSHSYKGYDSEVVVIAGADQFVIEREEKILANNLYVAMTRARSVLAVYAYAKKNHKPVIRNLLTTLEECRNGLLDRPKVEQEISNLDDFEDVLVRLGAAQREWLAKLWKSYLIQQEPLTAEDGEILAEPLFWFQADERLVACFGNDDPGPHTLHKLEDKGIEVIKPGQEWSRPSKP